MTATTFGSDLTLNTGRDVVSPLVVESTSTTSSENLHWGSGNLLLSIQVVLKLIGYLVVVILELLVVLDQQSVSLVEKPWKNSGVFRKGVSELYYDNNKKFETTGSGTTTYGTALTQQLNVTGVSTFGGDT